ncbi:MAG TPA: DNA polymerase III subunit beta [Bacteroidetes bacterium]|nr:DNA polymerase III subunit beta [Bacteroidota bacterium]
MRVSKEMVEFFKKEVGRLDPAAQVFLFGSRVDDSKKGGDIDVLILSGARLSRSELRELRLGFQMRFGEQRVDILNYRFDEDKPFKQLILHEAVPI